MNLAPVRYPVHLLAACALLSGTAFAQPADSLAGVPKHYFSTVIVLDAYRKPEKDLDGKGRISQKLATYGIRQGYLSFYTPLYTESSTSRESVTSNHHLLLTGTFLSLRPRFGGLAKQHNLVKYGIGLRYIYNSGKKGVWFADVSPFVTRDATYSSRPFSRLASTLVYSHNVSDRFNWRLGITKSFMWGNRFYLPFIGLRVGRLDKVHFSLQFPRSLQLTVPLGPKVILSAYTRPQGGLFNFSNHDTLYFRRTDATFHFARYELNTGVRTDVRVNPNFSFYAAIGLSTKNQITFFSQTANRTVGPAPYYSYFYTRKVNPTLFLNLGLVLKFGKTRSYYNEKNIYDAIDLNRVNGTDNGNVQIPVPPKKMPGDVNLESVKDLVDYNEL